MSTVALAVNVVLVPALAVLLVGVVGLGPDAALGVVLAAAAPGGGTGALLTLYARGDLAVSAALQAVYAPLGLVSVPVWAAVAGHDVFGAGAGGLVLVAGGLLGQVVPLGAGMVLLHRRPGAALLVHRVARRVADVLLAGLAYFVVSGAGRLPELGWTTAGVAAMVVAGCLAVTWLPWPGSVRVRRAIGMTTAVRNLSLALFVASTASTVVVLALLAYGLVMYGLSVPAAWWAARTPTA